MSDTTVSIVTYTQLDRAKACLFSLLNSGEDVDIILTSNGNPDAAKYFNELAASNPKIRVVVNPVNEGFWKPNNRALEMTNTRFLCLMNDDVIVQPYWLAPLRKPFLTDPKAVFSCPDSGCSELRPDFCGMRGRHEYCEGALLLINVEIAKRHGLFEPLPGLAYGEDSHASLRFRELGYTLHWVPLRIIHAQAATSRNMPEVRQWVELNHIILRRRWAHYLKVRKFDYPILVKRRAAWGDVLLITPILRALHEQKPQSPLWVETDCLDVLAGCPYIARLAQQIIPSPETLVIDLNLAYENTANTHIVDAYAKKAGLTTYDKRTETFLPTVDTPEVEGAIAVHVGPTSWRSKNWDPVKWQKVISHIEKTYGKVVLVGHRTPETFTGTFDLRGYTTVTQLASVLKKCKLLVTVDSFPLHLAQAVGTPVVGLFGVTDPQFIFTEGSKHIGVHSNTPSFGLRHRLVNQVCVDDQGAAMKGISAEKVIKAIDGILA